MDKNFQIVFPMKKDKETLETEMNISASSRAANSHAVGMTIGITATMPDRDAELMKKYLPRMPKTMDDCRILLEHLAQHNMVPNPTLLQSNC